MDVTELLAQVTEVQNTPGGANALLERLAQEDPRAQMVLEFLRRRQADASAPAEEPKEISRDSARYRRLRIAYDELYSLVIQLARALGACPRCWGEASECPICDGNGAPGSRELHEPSFDRFVGPALQARSLLKRQNSNGRHHREHWQPESSPSQEV